MHPTDTLLSLSHARIARAAAAGPRRATQPTALTDRQHMARIAQADAADSEFRERIIQKVGEHHRRMVMAAGPALLRAVARNHGIAWDGTFPIKALPPMDPRFLVEVTIEDDADPIATRHSVGAAIVRFNTLARADGILAQRIDAL